ncbi:aminotransferase class I/II-fold pyridoxal phosphate-dependent enzyme [Ancylomarina longa]|uniref:8-amino-7-oxononanoate synthase n=1 Tax=Ancylomarina longa TaxID=2487017 RepID=A0A434AES2_9BACT|nr:8-amino-7-oxononanoate synthase [Ancylomarina longa]RUT72879.1 8-amino-7-oxononanoate synthase [Ancylomarina longa]
MMKECFDQYQEELNQLKESGNYRTLKKISNSEFKVNLSSNDYLGVSKKNIPRPKGNSFGSGSSRLLTGNFKEYELLESELEKLYNKSALFFNSGYHANIGILAALTDKDDLILSDKLNHASIIDGMRLSNADSVRFKHLDYVHLENILKRKRKEYNRVFIVSESIFSMDGDEADLHRLIELKEQFNCILYLDEAHALGVRGNKGLGLSEEQNCIDNIDILIGTFGKAMNSIGAYAISNTTLKNYLINKMRSLIFTTALPPIVVNWNYSILKTIVKMSLEREHLMDISNQLRDSLIAEGLPTSGSSNIVPVQIGNSQKCVRLAEFLQKKGFLIFPIRPPAVPVNKARLRLSVCADMVWNDLKEVPALIKEFCDKDSD